MGDANPETKHASEVWEELVEELERATARLEQVGTTDLLALAQAMNARSQAVARVREFATSCPQAITPRLLERLQADYARGAAILDRLRVMQSNTRAEVAQLAERLQRLQGFAPRIPPVIRHVDYRG